MRSVAASVVGSLCVVASCGGDDDAADPARFCEVAEVFDLSDNPFALPPDQARTAIPEKQALMAESVQVAPTEIRSDVETMVNAFQPIFEVFEDADFDASQVDEAGLTTLADAAFGTTSTAGATVDEWIDTNCRQ